MDLLESLDRLPTELILLIIELLDFVGLEALLQLSPRVLAIFNHDPARIMRSIVPNSPVTGFELQGLFFECAFIHRPSLQINSLREYEARVHAHSAINPRLVFVGTNRAETRLVMRDMICVAAHIQKLSCTCLNIMRKSLFAAVSSSPVSPETAPGAALRQPSWIEEFRVYRALWHIKLKSNIAKAAQGSWIPSQYSSELRWGGWNWTPFDQEQAYSWYGMKAE